jgi:signal transduction histidine kinase
MSESAPVGHPGLDRTAGVAGALTYGMVGLLPVLTDLTMSPLWWAAWVVGIPAFLAQVLADLPVRMARWLIVPMVVIGCGMYALEPLYGFGGVPLVITAASAGLLLPLLGGLGVVALQSAVMLAIGYQVDQEGGLIAAVFYLGLQVFAVMTGQIARRESAARQRIAQVHESLRTAHSDLAKAHAELEAAQSRLAETSRTEERLRISRDLHDLVGHQLSALALNLEVATHVVDGAATEPVQRSRLLAKDLLADVRAVVSRLREETPDLRAAIDDVAAHIPRPVVHADVPQSLVVPPGAVRDAVVRSIQEALINSVRHSDADNVWVRVRQTKTGLQAEIHDDGHGAQVLTPGNGLTGMRERVEALGGTIDLDGRDGFRVAITVPLHTQASSSQRNAVP